MSIKKKLYSVFSIAVVVCMLLSGLTVLGPTINTIMPNGPELANEASAELDSGPDHSGADGHWEWGGSPWKEELVAGAGNLDETAEYPHDVLIIFDYNYYYANPHNDRDFYYSTIKAIVDDFHEEDLTVDTWYCYPFQGNARTHREGYYDEVDYFNYYPAQDVLWYYQTIMIYTRGPMYGGTYYYYDRQPTRTLQRTYAELTDYMEDGGNVFVFSRATQYYFTYYTTYLQSWGVSWVRNYLGITMGGYSSISYTSSYRIQGIDGTVGEGIGPTEYPKDYCYTWGYDRTPALYNRDTELAFIAGSGTGDPSMESHVGWQTDADYWRSCLLPDIWYMRYVSPPGQYYPGLSDEIRHRALKRLFSYLYIHPCPCCISPYAWVHPVEIQSSGTANEWVELTNTQRDPVNLYDFAVTTEDSTERPSSFFGDHKDLSAFGTDALLDDQTYYLNAEDLYIDTYWARGSWDSNLYLTKVKEGNEYGTYYHYGASTTTWWDANEQEFLSEDEKDAMPLGYLEEHVFQLTLPSDWWIRHQYVILDPGDDHKYETDQELADTYPSSEHFLDLDLRSIVDPDTPGNNESRALGVHWSGDSTRSLRSASLDSYYVRNTLTYGYLLSLYDDHDGSYITRIHMPNSPDFWKIPSLPYQGTIFVNDNHPETSLSYSRITGARVYGPGEHIIEIDLTDSTRFKHYTNEEYFRDSTRRYGGTTIDFRDGHIRNQITTVKLKAPILTDTVFVDKNSGNFSAGPGGERIIEIPIDLNGDEETWLFPVGATYIDYTDPATPRKNLSHLVVVTDELSDPDGSKNEFVTNGMVRMFNTEHRAYVGEPVRWGTSGAAPEPIPGMSAQAFFDGDRYQWYDHMTLGPESPGMPNCAPAPAYGRSDVVINEINPTFVELYNRGRATVSLEGWFLTGDSDREVLDGTISAGGFRIISEIDFPVPFTPVTGGRVSLFDDLGVLVCSIGYQTDVPGNQYSYVARHIDGIGTDYGYNDTRTRPWLHRDEFYGFYDQFDTEDAQKNADWDHGPRRTLGAENYGGVTVLQIGRTTGDPWSLLDHISEENPELANGTFGVRRLDDITLMDWDVVFCVRDLSYFNQWILNNYVQQGGRLYVEFNDWSILDGTDLSRTLGLTAEDKATSPVLLSGAPPVTPGMQLSYSGTTASSLEPNTDTYPVLEEGHTIYASMSIHIDQDNPANSFRAVASTVAFEKMSDTPATTRAEYIHRITDYFLLSDDDVNHAPVLELITPIPDPEVQLIKSRPTLLWENHDSDIWDQLPGSATYTLYISTDRELVETMDFRARSAAFVEQTAAFTTVDPLDAPVAGTYHWGILAEDRFGKTSYESGGAFTYDSEVPVVHSFTAMSGTTMDDPLPLDGSRVFGPGYRNTQDQAIGRPDGFAVDLSDNFGLRFSNNHNGATRLFSDEYSLPSTAFSVKVLYFYGGQYEDDLPNLNLYIDQLGTNDDLESLTGENDVRFYIIPDGPLPDGQYHIYVQAADEVRWGSTMDWTFEIDLTAPTTPTGITISPETFVDQTGQLFLMAGQTYTLSATAPSSSIDGSMSRVEFQQSASNYPGAAWQTIGVDRDVADTFYTVVWTPDIEHFYLRAIAYDYVENFAVSEVFSSFHVDGAGPEAPLTLQSTLDLTHTPVAQISGYVYDSIIEGQTSGVDYVVIWHYDEASGMMELVTDDQGIVLMVPVIDFQFQATVDLDAVSGGTGDKSYAFFAQAYDHVGNAGDMSDLATWTNTGSEESLRIISPSSIKDIPMGTDFENPDDSLDELRSITVTFLNTEQDFMNYQFSIHALPLRTSSDATALGMPDGTKFLYNYFNVEVPPEFTNFEAQVTIEFHISQRSQLGTKTSEILNNIRLVTKHAGENSFEVLDLIGGQAQPVDEAKGIYRVQARVNRFSDFAVIVAQTDLTVKDIILGANPAISGQEMSVTVTVHNGGDFPKDAENVKVKVFSIDSDGNQEYIGELDYGTIDAETDYYLSDAYLRKGDKQATLTWATTTLLKGGEIQKFTIRTQVDPDGYVREISETNNEKTKDVEVVGSVQSSPSFELTFMLMALGVMVVSGMSVYVRKKD